MNRAIISRRTLDALIRAKLATLEECAKVEALPVTHSAGRSHGCNWVVPGWLGESAHVTSCLDKLDHYLGFLRSQFDIPVRGTAEAGE